MSGNELFFRITTAILCIACCVTLKLLERAMEQIDKLKGKCDE